MTTQLITEDKNHKYSLVSYYGGEEEGTMYQITQYNNDNNDYYYVHLHKKDIIDILIRVLQSEYDDLFEVVKTRKTKKKTVKKK